MLREAWLLYWLYKKRSLVEGAQSGLAAVCLRQIGTNTQTALLDAQGFEEILARARSMAG